MAALAYSPQTPHAKAGQTQITLLGTSITGSVFALAHCVEKYFYEIRIGATYSERVCVYVCVMSVSAGTRASRNGINCCETSLKQQNKSAKSMRRELRASWQPPSQQVLRSQSPEANFPVAYIVPSHAVLPPPRPPCWTPDELACICGSWADQAMWLGEASAPYLGDY